MVRRYLLDTNIASYVIKGVSAAVDRRLMRVPMGQLYLSAVTEGELRFGVARLPEARRLNDLIEKFLLGVTIVAWDSAAAQQYGLLRARVERAGQPMGNLELMIAAHAMSQKMVLVTNDQAFARVETLKVEDWTKG